MSKPMFAFVLLLCAVFWTACGGGSSNNSGGGSTGGGGTGGGAVNPPVVVSVSGTQSPFGINIVVPAPASSPTPNATLVGADGINAFSSGDVLHRNSTATVIIAGTGLNTSMIASLSGPADITIGPLQSITFTNNSKGLSFSATVSANAALGARTLILQDAKNDITTFAGGLEVVP
jgi:hypothetical protein